MGFCLVCPKCRGKFRWQDPTKGFPDQCELCNEQIGTDRADDDIVMPSIRHARTVASDQVYRQMEAGSEVRAQAAADMAGVPVSDMASLKITDLNDRKDAEIAAVEDRAAMSRLAPNAQTPLDFFKPNGAEFSKGIGTGDVTVNGQTVRGIAPRAGASALSRIQQLNGRG